MFTESRRDSEVGVAVGHRLDDPGFESRWRKSLSCSLERPDTLPFPMFTVVLFGGKAAGA